MKSHLAVLVVGLLTVCVAPAFAIEEIGYDVVVISGAPALEIIVPALAFDVYIAEPTGEVIPDFVPGSIGKTKAPYTGRIFHPPKLRVS